MFAVYFYNFINKPKIIIGNKNYGLDLNKIAVMINYKVMDNLVLNSDKYYKQLANQILLL